MASIPTITDEIIEQFLGRRNTQHGREYFQSNAILDPHRQGPRLRASCIGSGRTPYQVQATIDGEGVADARCTCPVGETGQCKHVAALLICWQQSPESFGEFEAIDKALARCSRHQLVDVVQRLLKHRPELRQFIEPLPAPDEPVPVAEGADAVCRQAGHVVEQAENTPQGIGRLVESLTGLQQTAAKLEAEHESEAAAAVHRTILVRLLERVDLLDTLAPELRDVADESVQSLAAGLSHLAEDSPDRLDALRALLDLYRHELTLGGLVTGVDLSLLVCRNAAAGERRTVADWIRAMLAGVEPAAARKALGGLLLRLSGDELDEAERFDLCRLTGRIFDLAGQLIRAGRWDEAVAAARDADDADLVRIAELLVRGRREEVACRLVGGRLADAVHPILAAWLDRHRARKARREAALELSEKLFGLQPSFAAYTELRPLARQLGRWDGLHDELLATLQQAGRVALLVRIHLEENDLDLALQIAGSEACADEPGLASRVARAAERSRPLEALRIYRNLAERLIRRRGRANYAEACRHLRKVRAISKRTGDLRRWKAYLDRLLRQHRPVRTLRQELEAAGLLE